MKEENLNHISIVITGRNAVKFVDRCLQSAISQNYPNYEIIFIDANSEDGTWNKALEYKDKFKNIKFIRNETRKYQGENIRIGCLESPYKSIIVTLDSDDWFPHENVLARVNKEYVKHNCWMTFGLYIESPYRDISFHYHDYPLEVKQNKTFRQYKWLGTHLRSFMRELFLKIDENDLKDSLTGDYYENICDLSFQFPQLEMCGVDKSRFIRDVLYVYNRENLESDYRKEQDTIQRIESEIRNRKPYKTLEKLYEDE